MRSNSLVRPVGFWYNVLKIVSKLTIQKLSYSLETGSNQSPLRIPSHDYHVTCIRGEEALPLYSSRLQGVC